MTAKRWKQPACLLIKKMWYRDAMEYYSVLKRKEILSCYNVDESVGHYAKRSKPVTAFHLCKVSEVLELIKAEKGTVAVRAPWDGKWSICLMSAAFQSREVRTCHGSAVWRCVHA